MRRVSTVPRLQARIIACTESCLIPPIQRAVRLQRGKSNRGVQLTTQRHLVPRLRIRGAVPLLRELPAVRSSVEPTMRSEEHRISRCLVSAANYTGVFSVCPS